MQLSEILSPDIAIVAVIAVAVIFTVIIVLVANRISAIDNKISLLTEDLDKHVGKSLLGLSDSLHDDLDERSKRIENSLEHMGESWRDSLNKTVAHLRSEIDQFKSGIAEKTQQQYELLEDKLTEHATDVSEQLATVRDTHHQEVQNYHQRLATQVKEHAISEHKTLTGSLNTISKTVNKNFSDMVDNQMQTLENVASMVGKDHATMRSKIDTDIADLVDKLASEVAAMTGEAATNMQTMITDTGKGNSKMIGKVNSALSTLVSKVDDNVSGLNTKINSDLTSLTSAIAEKLTSLTDKIDVDLNSLTSQVIGRVSSSTTQLDEDLANISNKMDNQLSDLNTKMSGSIDLINTKVTKGFSGVTKKLDADIAELGTDVAKHFTSIEDTIDNRIRKEMSELQGIFKGFASKAAAIEQTRDKINDLAQNIDILSKVLDDRRSRGALGGLVLKSIIEDNLKPSDYVLNTRLSNGAEVDCLLKLPQPSGNIAISTKIDITDLENIFSPVNSNAEIDSARNKFRRKLHDAIDDAANNYIIPGETAEGTVLLLPSENAFSEVHVRHRDLVNNAYKQRVWLASPSTLIVMVSVARAVIKDATARMEMEHIHEELLSIETDYGQLAANIVAMTGKIDDLLDSATSTRKQARKLDERFISLNSMFKVTQQDRLPTFDSDQNPPTQH